jgi:hypothetical protein
MPSGVRSAPATRHCTVHMLCLLSRGSKCKLHIHFNMHSTFLAGPSAAEQHLTSSPPLPTNRRYFQPACLYAHWGVSRPDDTMRPTQAEVLVILPPHVVLFLLQLNDSGIARSQQLRNSITENAKTSDQSDNECSAYTPMHIIHLV